MMLSQDAAVAVPVEYSEDMGGTQAASIDLFAILVAALRRWKLITTITLSALIATYGVLKFVPSHYKSMVEILVYDPQQEINAAVQKPISPFVDAVGNEAMNTEIAILKSKSVALRVASELNLDQDTEFQPHNPLADLAARIGFRDLGRTLENTGPTVDGMEDEKAKRLDRAADALVESLQVWGEAYILYVTTTSQSPVMAQRLASSIAKDYLASQREARQEALQRVATWLKSRVDNLQSLMLQTEASIAQLKADGDIRDTEFNGSRKQQIDELNNQIMKARAVVEETRARLDQVRSVIDANGDVQSIQELTASATLMELRQKQTELSSRATDLQNKLGARHLQVIAARADLDAINQQISAETQHILGNIKNSYDIATRQEQSLEANLQSLTVHANSEAYVKLEQLQRVADADHKLYESYLSQYNDISERGTLQDASARIISPAVFPRSPSSPRRKVFYMLGGALGLGGGFLVAFLLEFRSRRGVRTGTEIERSFGLPVVGNIPMVEYRKARGPLYGLLLHSLVDEPLSDFSQAVNSLRIGLQLSNTDSKVFLITSALPGEGKSTAAMLLAASIASSSKRTILIDCDLHQQSISGSLPNPRRPGLAELLQGKASVEDVIVKDPISKTYIIPAGSMVPNAADLLMSQRMRDLIAVLRSEFDCIVIDSAPLLPVVDALVLTSIADRVLMIVEWSQTPHASVTEAFKILRPEVHRVAGIVFNKVDPNEIPGYAYRGGYRGSYGSKYSSNRRALTSTPPSVAEELPPAHQMMQ
jgi:succinoglycan biosynthesis transport protein ExoP